MMSRQRAGGFILMYVLGVMIVLSMLALSVAYKQRVAVQLVINEKETTQQDLVLDSAAQYTVAQLARSKALEPLVNIKDSAVDALERWQADGHYQISIGDDQVAIAIVTSVEPPDINLIDEAELMRLFKALGAEEPAAKEYAKGILRSRPKDGFATLDDLANLPDAPARFMRGSEAEEAGGESGPAAKGKHKGLLDLVTVGSKSKQISLKESPIELIAAFTAAPNEKLVEFEALRRSKPKVEVDEAVRILGDAVRRLQGSGNVFKAKLELIGKNRYAEVTIKESGGKWTTEGFKKLDEASRESTAEKPEAE